MKAGWKTVKLGDVADITSGLWKGELGDLIEAKVYRATNFIGNGELSDDKLVSIPVEVKKLTKRTLEPGDILLEKSGGGPNQPVGRVGFFDKSEPLHSFSNFTSRLRVSKGSSLDPKFLHKYLFWTHLRGDTASMQNNSTNIRNLDLDKYREIEIPLPPLAEQKRIVALLDEAFAAIDEAKAKAETNNENAKAVFARHLKCVFQDAPEDWIVRTIGDVCALKSGTTVAANIEKSFGDIPYLKVADMNIPANRNEITTSSRFLDKSDVKSANIIPAGSTIFPKRGGAILTNKKRVTTVPICADLNIMAAIPSDVLDSTFLYFYFLGVDMKKLGGGSSIPQINNYDIAPLLVCLPTNIETQRQVARKLADIREKTQTLNMLLEQKLARLSDLKKSLLSQAFAGELNA